MGVDDVPDDFKLLDKLQGPGVRVAIVKYVGMFG